MKPGAVIIGVLSQYTVMPLAALLIVTAFNMPPEIAVGVILVGTCPGGTASNVITYLSRGDVALSVSMTTASTRRGCLLLARYRRQLLSCIISSAC